MEYDRTTTTHDLWTYGDHSRLGADLVAGADPTGYSVEAIDGGIGKVDEATNEVGASHIVVDTGPWIFGTVMLLAGVINRVDPRERRSSSIAARTKSRTRPSLTRRATETSRIGTSWGGYYDSQRTSVAATRPYKTMSKIHEPPTPPIQGGRLRPQLANNRPRNDRRGRDRGRTAVREPGARGARISVRDGGRADPVLEVEGVLYTRDAREALGAESPTESPTVYTQAAGGTVGPRLEPERLDPPRRASSSCTCSLEGGASPASGSCPHGERESVRSWRTMTYSVGQVHPSSLPGARYVSPSAQRRWCLAWIEAMTASLERIHPLGYRKELYSVGKTA